ncbi:MAG: tetratricopeptide repeat protein, partial [Candidatus Omnitrophica bacterium]|nr:tetratricopeptide repeat protein [Candidatus Omnitrophota bacterium]
YQQSMEIHEELGNKSGIAKTLRQLGNIHQNQGNYEEAFKLYQQSLEIAKELGGKKGIADTLRQLGNIHQNQGNYEEAFKLYQQSLEIAKELGGKKGIADTLRQLGNIHQNQGNYEEAFKLYQQSLEIDEALGKNLGEAHFNYAVILDELGRTEEAEENYKKFIELNPNHYKVHYNFAVLLEKLGRIEEAIEYYHKALKITFDSEEIKSVSIRFFEVGSFLVKQGRWYEGLNLLEESLSVFRQGDDIKAHADTIYQIARTHHLMGNLDKARIHYRDALRLYDHISSQDGIAACKVGIGRLMLQMGFTDEALNELTKAGQIYHELNNEKRIVEIEEIIHLVNEIKEKQII